MLFGIGNMTLDFISMEYHVLDSGTVLFINKNFIFVRCLLRISDTTSNVLS
jgi:hypothetical protein